MKFKSDLYKDQPNTRKDWMIGTWLVTVLHRTESDRSIYRYMLHLFVWFVNISINCFIQYRTKSTSWQAPTWYEKWKTLNIHSWEFTIEKRLVTWSIRHEYNATNYASVSGIRRIVTRRRGKFISYTWNLFIILLGSLNG